MATTERRKLERRANETAAPSAVRSRDAQCCTTTVCETGIDNQPEPSHLEETISIRDDQIDLASEPEDATGDVGATDLPADGEPVHTQGQQEPFPILLPKTESPNDEIKDIKDEAKPEAQAPTTPTEDASERFKPECDQERACKCDNSHGSGKPASPVATCSAIITCGGCKNDRYCCNPVAKGGTTCKRHTKKTPSKLKTINPNAVCVCERKPRVTIRIKSAKIRRRDLRKRAHQRILDRQGGNCFYVGRPLNANEKDQVDLAFELQLATYAVVLMQVDDGCEQRWLDFFEEVLDKDWNLRVILSRINSKKGQATTKFIHAHANKATSSLAEILAASNRNTRSKQSLLEEAEIDAVARDMADATRQLLDKMKERMKADQHYDGAVAIITQLAVAMELPGFGLSSN